MAKNSFLLIDLQDQESKTLAQTIQNKSCRNILDFLANNKDATESHLSKALKLPLSTVHYNIQSLTKAKLVKVDEYHYSTKGREVNHYSLANKFIIIAPAADKGWKSKFRESMKGLVPLALIAAGGTGVLQLLTRLYPFQYGAPSTLQYTAPVMMEKSADIAAPAVIDSAVKATPSIADSASTLAKPVLDTIPIATERVSDALITTAPVVKIALLSQPALWFLVGAVVMMLVYFFWNMRKK